MTELQVYQQPAPVARYTSASDLDSWIGVATAVVKLANEICNTPFVPEGLRGSAPATAAAILAGREMGVGPMTALQHIHVIKGKTGLSALLMRALIVGQGHEWQDVHVSDVRVVVRGRRRGESEWTEASFTEAQARTAGITLNGYPQDKLYARASVRLARRKFADVIMGMPYSAEELEDGEVLDDSPAEQPAALADAKPAAARTARRRQAGPAGPGEDRGAGRGTGADRIEPSGSRRPSPLHPEDPAAGLPPLPGEEDAEAAATPAEAAADPAPVQAAAALADPKLTGAIVGHFERIGFTEAERDGRLAAIAIIIGREVSSSKELTTTEARAVSNVLSRCKDRDKLAQLLAAAAEAAEDAEDSTDG